VPPITERWYPMIDASYAGRRSSALVMARERTRSGLSDTSNWIAGWAILLRMRRLAVLTVVIGGVLATPATAQQDAAQIGARLLQDAAIKTALESIRAAEPQTLEDQVRLCEVEAPPFKEAKRAQLYAQMFKDAGLTNVRID
jgi:hypothetical protein